MTSPSSFAVRQRPVGTFTNDTPKPSENPPMRLATQEQSAIHEAIPQADADAEIYLFGSRVDDSTKPFPRMVIKERVRL